MLSRISENLHKRMILNGVTAPSVPVILYALQIITNTVGIVGLSLLTGWITGRVLETAVVLGVFAGIRFLSGGYHLKSGMACIVISTIVIAAIPHVPLSVTMMYICTGAALAGMIVYAPANYDKYATIDVKYFPVLKIAASVIVFSNFLIQSKLLAVIYIVQVCTLPFKEGGE